MPSGGRKGVINHEIHERVMGGIVRELLALWAGIE